MSRPRPESSRIVLSRQERHTLCYALMVAIETIQGVGRDPEELRRMRELLDRLSG